MDSTLDNDLVNEELSSQWLTYTLLSITTWILLFRLKTPLQYYIKLITYFVMVIIYSALITPFSLFRPNDCRNIRYL